MKAKYLLFYLILAIPTASFAQNNADEYIFHSQFEKEVFNHLVSNTESAVLELQLISDASADHQSADQHKTLLNTWVADLQSKQRKTKYQEQFLAHMFYKVHRKILKNYTPFSTLHSTLSAGNYDCLSGTTLYAILLNELGFEFDVIETNYHIYLRVQLDDNKIILIESTDPINGFISDTREIKSRLAQYKKGNNRTQGFEQEYVYNVKLNKDLNLDMLPGLHYYNEAVEAFNAEDLVSAVALLQKAKVFYVSQRINEFGQVLTNALLSDDQLPREEKRAYLSRISAVKESAIASIN